MLESLFQRKSKERNFDELYHEVFDYVYSFVFVRTAYDARTTEDILQETFAAAWMSQEMFQNKSAYGTWICAIARNKLKEHYRKSAFAENNEIPEECLAEQISGFNLEETVLAGEERAQVSAALNRINPVYRYSLIMKYIDGYSVKEIAKQLGRTAKAVDGLLQKAKKCFAREYLQLEERGAFYEGKRL